MRNDVVARLSSGLGSSGTTSSIDAVRLYLYYRTRPSRYPHARRPPGRPRTQQAPPNEPNEPNEKASAAAAPISARPDAGPPRGSPEAKSVLHDRVPFGVSNAGRAATRAGPSGPAAPLGAKSWEAAEAELRRIFRLDIPVETIGDIVGGEIHLERFQRISRCIARYQCHVGTGISQGSTAG